MYCKVIPIKPKSLQAEKKSLRRYQQRIKEFIKTDNPAIIDSTKKLFCSIFYFHRKKTEVDVDNICKPLIDAFKGTVIDDDNQLFAVLAVKIHVLEDDFTVSNNGVELDEFDKLLSFINSIDDVVYVEFSEAKTINLTVGGGLL